MPFTLTMPKLSPTMETGMIAKWHKKVGDFVESGDLLVEVATDKATIEHNALDEGFLRKILIDENMEAPINQPIAIFSEKKDENIDKYVPVEPTAEIEEVVEIEKNEKTEVKKTTLKKEGGMLQPEFIPEKPLEDYKFEWPTEEIEKRLKASPVAKKLATEFGLDLSGIKGSGPGGRIVKEDLARARKKSKVSFGRKLLPDIAPGSFTEMTLTPMRKIIATRLQEAKTFIPHFYVQQRVDADSLYEVKKQLGKFDIKLSFNDFVMRACALSLRDHPKVNRGFNSVNQSTVQFKTIDIAVAVTVEDGLITPIIRHADYKNISEISIEVKNLAKKAKAGKLMPQEYKGGSFTVSNLGMFGITNFQAILNPPQSAILALGGIQDIPVVKDGKIVPGKVMDMTLSLDHRVVDGVLASEFINSVKNYLENPALLLL